MPHLFKLIKLKLIILLSCYSSVVFSNVLMHHSPTPGGIAIIKFNTDKHLTPTVIYQGNRVLTIQNQRNWFAVVGIPLSVKPGIQYIAVHTTNGTQQVSFTVKPKTYKTERINIRYKGNGRICPTYELKVLRELKEIEATYRNWLATPNIQHLQLQPPIYGRKSSAFGLKRIFNGVPKRPHSGIDIAAPEGTPIKAPKDGIVIKTSRYCLTGNAIFLDHGQGFITSYFHLKKIAVKIGDRIKQGRIIGFVGRTGRVTGPHLHWSVSLNGVRVNPELFLPTKKK